MVSERQTKLEKMTRLMSYVTVKVIFVHSNITIKLTKRMVMTILCAQNVCPVSKQCIIPRFIRR